MPNSQQRQDLIRVDQTRVEVQIEWVKFELMIDIDFIKQVSSNWSKYSNSNQLGLNPKLNNFRTEIWASTHQYKNPTQFSKWRTFSKKASK